MLAFLQAVRMSVLLKGVSILVVEDDTDTRELLRILLQSDGGSVTAAASVPEALSAYDQLPPDVIVADIGMPEYNGYTLIGRVRARDREHGKVTPAIALTAYTTSIDRDTVLSAGFQVHMGKPFEPEKLVSVIADLATKYKQPHAS
jgi:CheY-like chemotaxis protein